MQITTQQRYRILALNLRAHHMRHCEGALCNISLESLLEMAEAAGAHFSEAERCAFYKTGEMSITPDPIEPDLYPHESAVLEGPEA